MAIYKVRVATADGKVTDKSIEAENMSDLDSMLSREGLVAVSVKEPSYKLPSFLSQKVSSKDLLIFNKGFMALLKAGLSIRDCLESLRDRTKNLFFYEAIDTVIKDVKSGASISEAMEKHPMVFPVLFRATIASGERTGDLVPSISSYVNYQSMVEALRKKVVGAMFYPVALLFISIGAVSLLLAFVVPTFASMYADTGTSLPFLTQILLNSQAMLKDNFFLIIFSVISMVIMFNLYINSRSGRAVVDRLLVKMPLIGEIYWGYAISKFTRTLSMILASGIPLVKSLEMSLPVLNNLYLEKILLKVILRAKEGESISAVMEELSFMPDVSIKMVSIGEKSASLPQILADVSDFHDEEVEYKIQVFTGLIEPALIVIMGIFIALIILMLYLPIFSLGEVI